MTNKKTHHQNHEGVSINARKVTIGGDVVGRDKITNIHSGVESDKMPKLVEMFSSIQKKIDQRKDDPQDDKAELKALVENIAKEVIKEEKANTSKIERWLRFLAEMANDIFEVTVSALINPIAGVTKTIQLIAQKAKEKSQ